MMKFTARTVANAEKEAGRSIIDMVRGLDVSSLAILVKGGMGLKNIEDAYEFIDKWIQETKGQTQMLFLDVMKQLVEDGFLAMNPAELDQLKKTLETSLNISTQNGNQENEQPSL